MNKVILGKINFLYIIKDHCTYQLSMANRLTRGCNQLRREEFIKEC